ncbi:MAG: haloacid dehalogenase-like hydrolase [Clostridia bacterium]|nr:haloacid dehalogenase-like hydrolase [Clostridia bacterium]
MIRVYDFDNTIFKGDSTARFCAYSLRKRPGLLLRLPGVAIAFAAMAIGVKSKTRAKEKLFRALVRGYENIDRDIAAFWDENFSRIKPWYMQMRSRDDVIISASPEFLLELPCKKLGVRLIGSRVDKTTGEYNGLNCHGEEKVRRYEKAGMPGEFEFYSDSLSDAPMAEKAARAFMVAGDDVRSWEFGDARK